MRLSAAVVVERTAQTRISSEAARGEASDAARCKHCGLVVPDQRRSTGYCCAGCEAVASLLEQEGLQRFYDLGGRGLGAVGDAPRQQALDWLPELEAQRRQADGNVCLTLDVQGIRCAACVFVLQELWKRQPGALSLRLDASMGRATLLYRGDEDTARRFAARAAQFGYPMAPAAAAPQRDRSLMLRLGVCAALAMNAMILAVAHYAGLADSDPDISAVFSWVELALATLSVATGGPVFFAAAWSGLRAGLVHMDLPISLGLLLAYGGSVHGHFTGGATYFDTVAMFTALMLGGRFLQQRSLERSRGLVLASDGAEHLRARRIVGAQVERVPVAQVQPGDVLLLAPGDLVPVQGRLDAAAELSLDWINGESEPRLFEAGAAVPAGAFLAGRRAVRLCAERTYLQSGLAEILSAPPIDREDPHGRVKFWSRLSRWYSAGVLAAAAIGAAIWLVVDPSRALPVAVALLVISCPCAFGLAAPLAFHLALMQLRRRGIFVRTRTLLDKLGRVRKVLFDKTGTVTHGGLRAAALQEPDAEHLPLLSTMAASSNHPASQAVLAALGPTAAFDAGLSVEEVPGQGMVARRGGVEFRLGGPRFCGVAPSPHALRECVLAADGQAKARYLLEEDFRDGAAAEIQALLARGLEVRLLSGDRKDRVQLAAASLGLPAAAAEGELSPQQKAERVRALDRSDTLMLGDGLNDAPAFAEAWCAGTPALDRPVLPHRADFFFRSANAGAVTAALDLAARYRQTVRANLLLALLYNGATLTLGVLDMVTPLSCAVLMPLSSLALIVHTTLRLGGSR